MTIDPVTGRPIAPLDFNSLFIATSELRLPLSDYYVEYAFYNNGIEPRDGMEVTFYDLGWLDSASTEPIVAVDAALERASHELGDWQAELKGAIYTRGSVPPQYFNAFIGAKTHERDWTPARSIEEAHLRPFPGGGPVDGISCHVYPPGAPLPRFGDLVGTPVDQLKTLLPRSDRPAPATGAEVQGDWVVVRGGSNLIQDYRVANSDRAARPGALLSRDTLDADG
jgi:hypothetical protein